MIRGVRGAITVDRDEAEEIMARTVELLEAMARANGVIPDRVASILFSTTPDLRSAFPAAAARRQMGWTYVPLMCMQEVDVPNALPQTIRILMHVDTERSQQDIRHVYLRGATVLRDDLETAEANADGH